MTAKRGPERATETRQYDLLRPDVGQKEPPRLGSTICCDQTWARRSHQDSAVRFVTAKSWPERATETRQYDLLRSNVDQKEAPRLGSSIFLRPRVGQKETPRLHSTICYGLELARKSHRDSAVRFVRAKSWREKSHRDSAVRFVTAKRWQEKATEIRQYDLLRPRVGQKVPPSLSSMICCGQEMARKSPRDTAVRFATAKCAPEKPPRVGSTISYSQTWPERGTKTRQYDLLRPRSGQKKAPRLGSTICCGQELARRATKTRQYDLFVTLLRPKVGQKQPVRFVAAKSWPEREPPSLSSTICYGQELGRKSHRDSAVRFVTAKSGPERATEIR